MNVPLRRGRGPSRFALTERGSPLQQGLQRVQVSRDQFGVSRERLVGYVGETEQGQHHLAASTVGYDAHRHVDLDTGADGDVVVDNAEVVPRGEPDLDGSIRSVRDPLAVHLLQRPGEAGGPAREVLGHRGEVMTSRWPGSAYGPGPPRRPSSTSGSASAICA